MAELTKSEAELTKSDTTTQIKKFRFVQPPETVRKQPSALAVKSTIVNIVTCAIGGMLMIDEDGECCLWLTPSQMVKETDYKWPGGTTLLFCTKMTMDTKDQQDDIVLFSMHCGSSDAFSSLTALDWQDICQALLYEFPFFGTIRVSAKLAPSLHRVAVLQEPQVPPG